LISVLGVSATGGPCCKELTVSYGHEAGVECRIGLNEFDERRHFVPSAISRYRRQVARPGEARAGDQVTIPDTPAALSLRKLDHIDYRPSRTGRVQHLHVPPRRAFVASDERRRGYVCIEYIRQPLRDTALQPDRG